MWLDDPNKANPTILGAAASGHGGFSTTRSPNLSGTSPLVVYFSEWPVNHQLGFTSTVGGTQPLIVWESLPAAAQDALQTTDFGAAIVPFKDSTFAGNLAAATF